MSACPLLLTLWVKFTWNGITQIRRNHPCSDGTTQSAPYEWHCAHAGGTVRVAPRGWRRTHRAATRTGCTMGLPARVPPHELHCSGGSVRVFLFFFSFLVSMVSYQISKRITNILNSNFDVNLYLIYKIFLCNSHNSNFSVRFWIIFNLSCYT